MGSAKSLLALAAVAIIIGAGVTVGTAVARKVT